MLDFGRSAALHMYNIWEMYSSVRLLNEFICSAFQHHRHIWGIQCTKNTQMNSVHSFSLAHNRKSKHNFTFNGILNQWKKIQKNKVKEKLFPFIFIFPTSLCLSLSLHPSVLLCAHFAPFSFSFSFSGFSFSNSIDSCVFGWAWQLGTRGNLFDFPFLSKNPVRCFFSLCINPQLASEVCRKTKICSNEIRKSINRKWMMLFYVSHKMCSAMNLSLE